MPSAEFPDVEARVRAWLISTGMTQPISTRKSRKDKKPAWLQLVRIGGSINTLVTEVPQLELSGYGDTDDLALAVLNSARQRLHRSAITADAPFIWSDEYGGPVNLPDPDLPEQSRYTANWTLWTRF